MGETAKVRALPPFDVFLTSFQGTQKAPEEASPRVPRPTMARLWAGGLLPGDQSRRQRSRYVGHSQSCHPSSHPTIAHIDYGDEPFTPSTIVPLGRFKGAALACPQLDVQVPVHPGRTSPFHLLLSLSRSSTEACSFLSHALVHAASDIDEGVRICLTFFTDHNLVLSCL